MPNGTMVQPPVGNGVEPPQPSPEEAEETPSKSALLPKSIFPTEPKVGDTITLRVAQIFSDEIECEIASEPTASEPTPATADQEIEAASTEME